MRQDDAREAAWLTLEGHAARLKRTPLKALFAAEPARVARWTGEAAGLTLDLSRQRIDDAAFAAFEALAEVVDLRGQLKAMRAGAVVNGTENRPALHVALRGAGGDAAIAATVAETRAAMRAFAADVASGKRAGAGGPYTAIVHIGIGGSDLGPRLVLDALKRERQSALDVRFAANVDGAEIDDALEGLEPARTLVIVVSKTFTTLETLANADVARAWLAGALGDAQAQLQIAAVSAAPDKARAWGASDVFPFWDWVGGRYSLWSAVGLTTEIALRPGTFDRLLTGAAALDAHMFDAPFAGNLPFRAAAVQSFNRLLGHASTATIAYARRLQLLPAWLQQLEMESNGKGVDAHGSPLARSSAGVTWGDSGTNAQHSFFQLLHQGRDVVPVDFVVLEEMVQGPSTHRNMTLANALAQAQALYEGKSAATAEVEMHARGETPERARFLAPHRAFGGDRPSSMLALSALTPESVGALLAFYEHRTVMQAWLAGINPFDQWGVELGKAMAAGLLPALQGGDVGDVDPATAAWVARLRR
jgi:glucose-6-phosphate isomerase